MTWAWAGPFCSLNLAHLGAEVIRIESELRADLYRRLPIYPVGIEEGLNCSGMFNQWNQGKRSVALDFQSVRGRRALRCLCRGGVGAYARGRGASRGEAEVAMTTVDP